MKFGLRIPPPQMSDISDPEFIMRYAQLADVSRLNDSDKWEI